MPLALHAHRAPRATLMATDPGGTNNWWVVAGTIAATFTGAVLKTFVDLVGKRDSSDASWRKDIIKETHDLREEAKALREWNGHQQEQLNANATRMASLETAVHDEKELRHEIRNQLMREQLLHEGLKHDYAALKAEHEKVVALYEALLKSTASATPPTDIQ
jgi:flagellar motility protein MotE (MotC chaperone)